jgi:predicted nicotinamide N-methyase
VKLVEESLELAGRSLTVLRPPDAEALIDERAFERDEFLPYWAELWPSGLVLARAVGRLQLGRKRVLELGCGLGLPSLAAAARGAAVLATDWSADAIELLRHNAVRNGLALRAEVGRWDEPEALSREAPWDLVLAADVLYECRNVEPLLALLPALGREVLLADPSRPSAAPFLEAVSSGGWRIETSHDPERQRVAVHRLTLC